MDDSADEDGTPDCSDQCPGADDDIYAPGCADAIPTISEWGVVIMSLLMMVVGKIYFSRRSAARRSR